MIMGPLLLEFGLHPMVSAATSGLMVLFSSSIAAFSFGFDLLLNTQFALVRLCLPRMSDAAGQGHCWWHDLTNNFF